MMAPQNVARFCIVRKLGAGGMGEVYLADDPALERQVALKRDRAFEWLNRAFDSGGSFIFYKDSSLWDRVRTDPRFVKFLRRMGLLGTG